MKFPARQGKICQGVYFSSFIWLKHGNEIWLCESKKSIFLFLLYGSHPHLQRLMNFKTSFVSFGCREPFAPLIR